MLNFSSITGVSSASFILASRARKYTRMPFAAASGLTLIRPENARAARVVYIYLHRDARRNEEVQFFSFSFLQEVVCRLISLLSIARVRCIRDQVIIGVRCNLKFIVIRHSSVRRERPIKCPLEENLRTAFYCFPPVKSTFYGKKKNQPLIR